MKKMAKREFHLCAGYFIRDNAILALGDPAVNFGNAAAAVSKDKRRKTFPPQLSR
jgi:hypothetical protein